jgi:hypothetical protein
MSRIVIVILIYHRHKHTDLTSTRYLLKPHPQAENLATYK